MNLSVEWLSDGVARLLAAFAVCAFFFVFAFFLAAPLRTRKLRYIAGPLAATLVSFFVMLPWEMRFPWYFTSYEALPGLVRLFGGLPVWIGGTLDLAAIAGTCVSEAMLRRHLRESITEASVRESVDNLPAGLCFALEGGLPLMVNRTMEDLCQSVTGDGLLNANRFWDMLCGQEGSGGVPEIEAADAVSLRMNDGRTWIFTRRGITVDGEAVVQYTATDATDLYALGRRLEEDNRALADMNRRLSRYGEGVTELTRDEEILEAKMQIHDNLGQILMASRFALSSEERDPDFIRALFAGWRQSVALLRHEAVPETAVGADPVRQIEEAAEAAGVQVTFRGHFPREDRAAARLLFTATREALTNAVRHAGADALEVEISETAGFWQAVFRNDGEAPAGPIVEGGGLSGLRRRIEDAGGAMSVSGDPAFALILVLPKRTGDAGEAAQDQTADGKGGLL